jgi:hypothetical protein
LTEAATVVGGTLIIALREPSAASDALIKVGFAYRRITASRKSYSAVLVRNRYAVFIRISSDSPPGIHGFRRYYHAQDNDANRA